MSCFNTFLRVSISSLLWVVCLGQEPTPQIQLDANQIFNALHSSLRQFGSSLNHNGMSIFLASVPASTHFYHGNGSPDPVEGMEWLAFEPEHAMMFARKMHRPPSRPPSTEQHPLSGLYVPAEDRSSALQEVMDQDQPRRPHPEPGWLHTFKTKHRLRLVYLDGMSAGKTSNGTLDVEDFLLLRSKKTHPEMWDVERAQKLCHLAAEDWEGRIDGFLRMEAGFEIILCDFEQHLETVHVNRVGNSSTAFDEENAMNSFFNYWRAVSDRFYGIGGGRAIIHHDRFVTAYGRDLELFVDGDMPRLLAVQDKEMTAMRSDVDQLIADSPAIFSEVEQWTDWQAVADLIVTRYSSRLRYMTADTLRNDTDALHKELDRTLAPFIDYDHRDIFGEIRTCTAHFLPSVNHTSQASDVVTSVSYHICASLFSALKFSSPSAPSGLPSPHDLLDELTAWLGWTAWKACGPCRADELCVVPVWPFGSWADHEHPSCHNASSAWSQHGYWGGPPRSNGG